MSTFKGFLVDPALSFIAIDNFEEHVYSCDIFLLSHYHTDHTKGIQSFEFCKLVNETPTKILHCSPITAHFLRKDRYCSIRDDKIAEVEIDKPLVIQHKSIKTDIVITLLPAAHCPGSVMFLIEFEGKRILYSGDIRLNSNDVRNIVGTLTNRDGSVIQIDDLYLDTTFAFPSQLDDFPSREASELTIIDFIHQFLSVSSKRQVVIQVVARFGYENLFIRLSKQFQKPVAVHKSAMMYYEDIQEVRDYVSDVDDGASGERNWLIHICPIPTNCKAVKLTGSIRVFKPCALSFVNSSNRDVKFHAKYHVPYSELPSMTKVFYSTHSSLKELRAFYAYLKPKRVFPSVRDDRSFQEILSLIGAVEADSAPGLKALPSERRITREEYNRTRLEIRKKLKFNG